MPSTNNNYVLGIDYGTECVRSVLLNTKNGDEIVSPLLLGCTLLVLQKCGLMN